MATEVSVHGVTKTNNQNMELVKEGALLPMTCILPNHLAALQSQTANLGFIG